MNESFMDTFESLALKRYKEAKQFWANWRAETRDAYGFIAGDQWIAEDVQLLQEQRRPPITFNYSEKMIDAVCGAEVSGRQETRFYPREVNDSGLADLWTNAASWVRDECNAEDEERDAFRDCLICGLGWTETRLDYEVDGDGKIMIERRDPLEMLSDPAAIKAGLSDARYIFHETWVDEREVARLWPDSFVAGMLVDEPSVGDVRYGHRYEGETSDDISAHKGQVRLVQYQCYEKEPYVRVPDKQSGQIMEVAHEDFAPLQKEADMAGIKYAKMLRRVYYRAWFAGETLLEKTKSPCQDDFTFKAITGKRDRNRSTWYGLTRVMKDPQRWANKWLSQILHIVNTNAKGGILAEVGAFLDPRKAEEEWAQPDSVTILNEGGLSKVQPKTPSPYPSGLDRLMEFALNSLPMVTGINLEALGLANREQAGVLEQQRKQAAYGLLAPLFDGLRRYRKNQGRVLLYFIHEYISDGRLIRISGKDGQEFLPLVKAPHAMDYDIVVDQSPNSPDSKEKTWETLMQILPTMIKTGNPLPPDILDYTPLPATLSLKWKQFIAQNKQQASPQQMQQMQQQLQKTMQENQQLKMGQQESMAAIQQKGQESQALVALKAKAHQDEMALKQMSMEKELALKAAAQERELAIKQAEVMAELERKHMAVMGDLKIKAVSAGVEQGAEGDLNLKLDIGPLAEAMKSIAESQNKMADAVAQGQEATLQAIKGMDEALSRPKEVIFNKAGKPVGIKPVGH